MSELATPPAVRRGRPGYDRRAMLELAVQVFNEQGYDATSVADLAARFGLTKSALYHHFDSKEQLLEIALDQALGGLEAALEESATGGADAVDRLARVVRAAVHVLVAQLPSVTLLLRVRGNSDVERRALDRRRRFDLRITQLVRDAQTEGSIRADIAPSVVTRLIFGMVNSIVEWYRPGGAQGPDDLARDVLTVALDGLRTA